MVVARQPINRNVKDIGKTLMVAHHPGAGLLAAADLDLLRAEVCHHRMEEVVKLFRGYLNFG